MVIINKSMKFKRFIFLCKWFDKLAKVEETDAKVEAIKQEAIDKVDATTKSIEKVGQLQRLVMQKTTTYYIGKAIGAVK